jgi:ribosomal-protein-alanine N-acetyltransferase
VFGLLDSAGGVILVRTAADEAEILTLAVSPGVRRRGIGGILFREATTQVAALGAAAVFLEVSVVNSSAIRLYTREGFVQVGRRARYYSDHSDALVLRLDFGSAA